MKLTCNLLTGISVFLAIFTGPNIGAQSNIDRILWGQFAVAMLVICLYSVMGFMLSYYLLESRARKFNPPRRVGSDDLMQIGFVEFWLPVLGLVVGLLLELIGKFAIDNLIGKFILMALSAPFAAICFYAHSQSVENELHFLNAPQVHEIEKGVVQPVHPAIHTDIRPDVRSDAPNVENPNRPNNEVRIYVDPKH